MKFLYRHQPPVLTEDVFYADKEGMGTIIDAFAKIKEAYIKFKRINRDIIFNNEKFAADKSWKDLEDAVQKKFNFRSATFRHIYKLQGITTSPLRAYTYNGKNRLPIEGLLTEKGLWDSTNSLDLVVNFEPILLDLLTPEELTAVLLHQIGHNIDPAVVDINFVGMQKFIDYLGDRKLTKEKVKTEAQKMWDLEFSNVLRNNFTFHLIASVIIGPLLSSAIINIRNIIHFFQIIFFNPKAALNKLKSRLNKEKNLMDIYNNSEAFADNFARMYGMGHYLISGLDKLHQSETKLDPWMLFLKYKTRNKLILDLCINSLGDVHKTRAHRLYNMIKEYEKDLADESIPEGIKKGLREDKKQLEDIIEVYNNDKENFASRVAAFIIEYLRDKDLGELRVKERK